MAGAAIDYTYRYPFESSLTLVGNEPRLSLAVSRGVSAFPYFFRGVLTEPRRTADMLLAVSRVAQSRFYVPPGMVQRILREADPVITSGGDRLRFESFSQCCGVYVRLDLLPGAIDGDVVGRGTTNVDFNAPMRAALAQLTDHETVALSVGASAVELEHRGESVIERKVALPTRWLKGFVEVQACSRRLQPVIDVSGMAARKFFSTLTKQVNPKNRVYVVRSGTGLRMSQRQTTDSVALGGPNRLQLLASLARHATCLRIYGGDDGVSCWELDCGSLRLEMVLSPDASRGFSGEGQVLEHVAADHDVAATAKVHAALKWRTRIDPDVLAAEVELPASQVQEILAVLGTRGLVGFDVAERSYFHRELPFDFAQVESLHPRLQNARKLVASDGVRLATEEGVVTGYVRGSGVEHRVRLLATGPKCTCPWYSKHQGQRGVCKHILAVQIAVGDDKT